MYEDGGPVIGIQIENEYGHVGGQTGEAGEQHMRTLQKMAKRLALRAIVYSDRLGRCGDGRYASGDGGVL